VEPNAATKQFRGKQSERISPNVINTELSLDLRVDESLSLIGLQLIALLSIPAYHHDNCYFCMVDISRYRKPRD